MIFKLGRLGLVFGLLSFFFLLTFWINGQIVSGIDDANIYFVYMQNFAEGFGFVYNPGEERVEGFTSLLWTIIGGGLFSMMGSEPGAVLMAINFVLIGLASWVCLEVIMNYLSKDGKGKLLSPAGLLFLLLLFAVPGFIDWTVVSLLETGLWTFVLSLSMLFVINFKDKLPTIQSELLFGALLGLLVLIRPEAILWGPILLGIRGYLVYLGQHKNWKSLKFTSLSLIIFLGVLVGLVLWRLSYFGYPLPNTFYAKVSDDKLHNAAFGLFYVLKNFLYNPIFFLCLLLIFYSGWKFKNDYKFLALALLVIITFSIPLYTGGDHFNLARFIQPSYLIILLLIVFVLSKLKLLNYTRVVFLGLFLAFTPNPSWGDLILTRTTPISHEFSIATSGRNKGEKFNEFFAFEDEGLPEVGVLTAGGFAFSYQGETNDLLGLNNVEMAHHKQKKDKSQGPKNHSGFVSEVFFEQAPDLFLLSLEILSDSSPVLFENLEIGDFSQKVFRNIQLDSAFTKSYFPVVIDCKHLNYSIKTFSSVEFLNSLDTEDYSYRIIGYND